VFELEKHWHKVLQRHIVSDQDDTVGRLREFYESKFILFTEEKAMGKLTQWMML